MSYLEYPRWLQQPANPPPRLIDPVQARENAIANNTRAEESGNGFLAAKQQMLFTGPDAFYGKQGSDAIKAAPAALDGLGQLKDGLMGGLVNYAQRQRLGSMLDAQIGLERERIARHVADQYLAWQRSTAQDRIDGLIREAALHHNDSALIGSLADAAAGATLAKGRVGGVTPEGDGDKAATAAARSGVLNAAIQARLDSGNTLGASELYDQVQAQLAPEHAEPLGKQIETAQNYAAAKDYVAGITPASPALTHDEIEAQRATSTAQNQADNSGDPAYRQLAQHFIDVRYDGQQRDLHQAQANTAKSVDDWVNTPKADGNLQTDPPSPALWNRLDSIQQSALLARLSRNSRGGGPQVMSDAAPEPMSPGRQYAQARPPRHVGPSGQDLTPREELRWTFFRLHRDELEELEPGNPRLTYISPPGWVPSQRQVDDMYEELQAARQRAVQRADPAGSTGNPMPGPTADDLVVSSVPNGITARQVRRPEDDKLFAPPGSNQSGERVPVKLEDGNSSVETSAKMGRAAQLAVNRAAGRLHEEVEAAKLERQGYEVGTQLTLETSSGKRVRMDIVARDPTTGEIRCIECKASETAPLSRRQRDTFPEIEQSGAAVKGAGKDAFPSGTQISPTTVEINRRR
jgi:hypothetical protein